MPIAVDMSGATTPTSPRMTKAAFFRARSPPALDRSSATGTARAHSPNELAARFHQMDMGGPSRSPASASPVSDETLEVPRVRERGYASSVGTTGHTPEMDNPARMRFAPESAGAGGGDGGPDEMLLTLLAGQATVDCEGFGMGAWEEVEGWKKELAILTTRLESLVARHQREVKILTAARTLQKLNNTNKRMSKQTTEHLEQAEKRAEAAEKDVLQLREREGAMRRRLMEHWAGVMLWEVRRLERTTTETQARFKRQSRHLDSGKEREAALLKQLGELEGHLDRRGERVEELQAELVGRDERTKELEDMVVDMGRRERAGEEEVRALEKQLRGMEVEKEGWGVQRHAIERDAAAHEEERAAWKREKEEWTMHKRVLADEMDKLVRDRQRMVDAGKTSEVDKAALQGARGRLGAILQRPVEDVEKALHEVEGIIERHKHEASMPRQDPMLEKRLRNHEETISDLTLRNETLSASLAAASSASSSTQTSTLQARCDALTHELESIAGQFNEVWTILPPLSRRVDAHLATQDGKSNRGSVSPNAPINLQALQQLYAPSREQFGGIDEMLSRVRGLVDDGKVFVERISRLQQEREMYKSNAAKAKKLVENSQSSLATYQQQVAVLEDRLAKSGSTESHFLEELNSLRGQLDKAQITRRQLEAQIKTQTESAERLQQANDDLSARVLSMADDADAERVALSKKMQGEMETMRREMNSAQEDADEERARGQAQRIQLLDELNSLQAEVGELRKQLRIAKGT